MPIKPCSSLSEERACRRPRPSARVAPSSRSASGYALADSDLTGVWGGTSERGRRLIRSAAKIPTAEVVRGSVAS